jgi:hypothetical protein
MSKAEPNVEWLRDVSLIGTHQIANTVNVINDTLNGFTVRFLSRRRTDVGHRLDLPKIRN